MKARMVRDLEAWHDIMVSQPDLITWRRGEPWVLCGTVYEARAAWKHCNIGHSDPADDECREMCERNPPKDYERNMLAYHDRVMAERREWLEEVQYLKELAEEEEDDDQWD